MLQSLFRKQGPSVQELSWIFAWRAEFELELESSEKRAFEG